MLIKLFVLWILMSLFCGSRTAGSTIRFIFGIIVVFWVIRLLFGFGLMLLPVILVVLIYIVLSGFHLWYSRRNN